jgi:hypothetical protein
MDAVRATNCLLNGSKSWPAILFSQFPGHAALFERTPSKTSWHLETLFRQWRNNEDIDASREQRV